MNTPAPRMNTALSTQTPNGFTRAENKQLIRLENAELTHGYIAATRVQAATTVAAIGLQATGMLSREASFQANGDQAAANRLNFIVDQFASLVGNEVARFGF